LSLAVVLDYVAARGDGPEVTDDVLEIERERLRLCPPEKS
jgi:hypothetical protein